MHTRQGEVLMGPVGVRAGPPFITDDPEPVNYRHWEFYLVSQHFRSCDGWSGTAPHVELNYEVISNLQLYILAPMVDAPAQGSRHGGCEDMGLGTKYRFVQETETEPQIGRVQSRRATDWSPKRVRFGEIDHPGAGRSSHLPFDPCNPIARDEDLRRTA